MNDFEIKQIPVFANSIAEQQIGWAEINRDGSVTIAIQPGEIEKSVALKFVEQIEGFFVNFRYREAKVGMTQVLRTNVAENAVARSNEPPGNPPYYI